jgi:hypothetical protein
MKSKTTHWIVTGSISFFMVWSAYMSGTRAEEFAAMGFPNYFRIELTAAKIIGAIALLAPWTPARVREWVYVGFSINLISAAIAKYNGDYSVVGVVEPLAIFAIMVGMLVYLERLNWRRLSSPEVREDSHSEMASA